MKRVFNRCFGVSSFLVALAILFFIPLGVAEAGTYYRDYDGDGYGNGLVTKQSPLQPVGYVANYRDCNDNNPTINPNATEICDGWDNDCDFAVDEGCKTYYRDNDGDGCGVLNNRIKAFTRPAGYAPYVNDCDDSDPTVHPNAYEACDGKDNNCNTLVDEGCKKTYYQDTDNDGYGNPNVSLVATSKPTGYVLDYTDCDDSDAAVNPNALEVCGDGIDQDCDGGDILCDNDQDGHDTSVDCNDNDATIHPGVPELCDGVDNNCDGQVDEGCQIIIDIDNDGYDSTVDCNDNDPYIHPGATELCDGADNDCDGQVDEGCLTYYQDADGDTYGNAAVSQIATSQPTGYVANSADCNDNDPSIYPGAIEIRDDGIDQNCDGVDAMSGDDDNDFDGYSPNDGDCNDNNAAIHPGATELCDGADNNCDGQVDEGCLTYYQDADGDTYGNAAVSQIATSQPTGYVANSADCNDGNVDVHPGATEICGDNTDNNCDNQADEGCPCIINVPANYATIQGAINVATNGCTILVANGTYYENINFNGKAITVKSVNGAGVTTINGNASGSVVTFKTGETSASALDGFMIANGTGTLFTSSPSIPKFARGGGIYCYYSSPTIKNCIITGNFAINGDGGGGGITCYYSSPNITNCTISGNSAGWQGGGVECVFSSPIILNCEIANNYANIGAGGGIKCDRSSYPVITNCTITNNHANNSGGGGINCEVASPNITNCIISGNSAILGGGICAGTSAPLINNCTIVANTATLYGGGIYCSSLSSPTILNSILWGDIATTNEIYVESGSTATVTYSNIQGGWAGTGNINSDPLFVGGDNYHLKSGSPCINAGTATGAPADDIDGEARPKGAGYDMGADEY